MNNPQTDTNLLTFEVVMEVRIQIVMDKY